MRLSDSNSNQYLRGLKFRLRRLKSLLRVWQLSLQSYPDLGTAWKAFRSVARVAKENAQIRHLQKGLNWENRFYTLMGLPGYPSPAFDLLVKNELHRELPINGFSGGLAVLLFAFTKKCPLRCEHCFEWEALNHKETLSLQDMLIIVQKFQAFGVAQIELSGGEPLHRMEDMLELLKQSDTIQTDFWMLTSGYHLTLEKAQKLKNAGLRGISVSLDHWNAADHDRFRNMEGAYDWALQAVQNARHAGLLVSLSLVTTRAFCTAENLWRYAELARKLQVHMIRLLEPRATGHYAGMPVELGTSELAVCEDFVRQIQLEPAYKSYPLVEYHATYQRKVGCGGAGKRYLYVDTDGDVHACPFCQRKVASAITMPIAEILKKLRNGDGCPAFQLLSKEQGVKLKEAMSFEKLI